MGVRLIKKKNSKKIKLLVNKLKRNKKLIFLFLGLLIIFLIIIFIINSSDDVISNEREAKKELIKHMEKIEEKRQFFSVIDGQDFVRFDLTYIRELSSNDISKLNMCNSNNTYVDIHLNEEGKKRYTVYLDCNFK